MNSVIQQLFLIPGIKESVLSIDEEDSSEDTLFFQLQMVFGHLLVRLVAVEQVDSVFDFHVRCTGFEAAILRTGEILEVPAPSRPTGERERAAGLVRVLYAPRRQHRRVPAEDGKREDIPELARRRVQRPNDLQRVPAPLRARANLLGAQLDRQKPPFARLTRAVCERRTSRGRQRVLLRGVRRKGTESIVFLLALFYFVHNSGAP